ncbi:hypothetical protein MYXA107069_23850 [Myxococcus xanthus]
MTRPYPPSASGAGTMKASRSPGTGSIESALESTESTATARIPFGNAGTSSVRGTSNNRGPCAGSRDASSATSPADTGRHAPPASSTPHSAMTDSTDGVMRTATGTSRPTPSCFNRAARPRALSESSRHDRRRSPMLMATASGVRFTHDANRASTAASARSRCPMLDDPPAGGMLEIARPSAWRLCTEDAGPRAAALRSSGAASGIRDTRRSGFARAAPSNVWRWADRRAMRGSS